MTNKCLATTGNALIARELLGWKPPVPLALAVQICDGFTFTDEHYRDEELDRLTKFWTSGDSKRLLPDFRTEGKSVFRLLREFHGRNLFVEIVGHGSDYVVTVYADSTLETILGSGISESRTGAIYFATIDFLNSRYNLSSMKSAG